MQASWQWPSYPTLGDSITFFFVGSKLGLGESRIRAIHSSSCHREVIDLATITQGPGKGNLDLQQEGNVMGKNQGGIEAVQTKSE